MLVGNIVELVSRIAEVWQLAGDLPISTLMLSCLIVMTNPIEDPNNYICQAEVSERTGLSAKRLRRHDRELGVIVWANRPAWPSDRVAAFVAKQEQERELIARTLSSHEVAARAGCCSNYVIKNFEPVAVVGAYRRFRYDPSVVDAVIERLTESLQRQIEALQSEMSARLVRRSQVVPSSLDMAPTEILPTAGKPTKQVVRTRGKSRAEAAQRADRIKESVAAKIDGKKTP